MRDILNFYLRKGSWYILIIFSWKNIIGNFLHVMYQCNFDVYPIGYLALQ